MFKSIRLQNFKSWRDPRDIKLAPIAAFFGANSSGKTSIIQALLLLKQTAEYSDRHLPLYFGGPSSIIDLGDFPSVAYNHDMNAEIRFQMSWEADSTAAVPNGGHSSTPSKKRTRFGFETGLRADNPGSKSSRIYVEDMNYSIHNDKFGIKRSVSSKPDYELYSDRTEFRFQRIQGRHGHCQDLSSSTVFLTKFEATIKTQGFCPT